LQAPIKALDSDRQEFWHKEGRMVRAEVVVSISHLKIPFPPKLPLPFLLVLKPRLELLTKVLEKVAVVRCLHVIVEYAVGALW